MRLSLKLGVGQLQFLRGLLARQIRLGRRFVARQLRVKLGLVARNLHVGLRAALLHLHVDLRLLLLKAVLKLRHLRVRLHLGLRGLHVRLHLLHVRVWLGRRRPRLGGRLPCLRIDLRLPVRPLHGNVRRFGRERLGAAIPQRATQLLKPPIPMLQCDHRIVRPHDFHDALHSLANQVKPRHGLVAVARTRARVDVDAQVLVPLARVERRILAADARLNGLVLMPADEPVELAEKALEARSHIPRHHLLARGAGRLQEVDRLARVRALQQRVGINALRLPRRAGAVLKGRGQLIERVPGCLRRIEPARERHNRAARVAVDGDLRAGVGGQQRINVHAVLVERLAVDDTLIHRIQRRTRQHRGPPLQVHCDVVHAEAPEPMRDADRRPRAKGVFVDL